MIPAHTILFAAPDDPESVEEARAYISDNRLTAEQVKLIRTEDQIRIVSKTPITLEA